ncbi:autotransporter domain-containing protein [Roseomonas sp. NAR14]|uniref:Autotransporter domain-containing protein n=1 Tax=Roseomonas acroporae TaxID=2937791 RepID=A0A9X1YGA4_9PROT|nr:autotransporter domain-containing protein [Roseomonas acroporae]MCK8785731.1 autotransporter domain-containing protein [Roseomonas acroporae]
MRRYLLLSTALLGFAACPGAVSAQTAANIQATGLLSGFSLLLNTQAGRTVLDENLATAISINNNSTAAQRAQAISDNTIGALIASFQNGLLVADGLGPKLQATFAGRNTVAANYSATALSPAFQALMYQATTLTGSDSAFAKNFLANGSSNGSVSSPATGISLPAGGVFNVYDRAYDPPASTVNLIGNSRPTQVALPRYQGFTYNDFFGVPTNNLADIVPTLRSNAAFPSGHSAFGFTASTLLALMVPERFQQMLTRGAEYGYSRVVVGAHYPLDVIGARIHTLYGLVQMLNNSPLYTNQALSATATSTNDFQALFASATGDLRALLATCDGGLAACAANAGTADRFAGAAANRAFYRYTLTYGLDPVGPTNLAPVVPTGAEVLLATRFPYLSADQRREVLATTELPSGQPLDDGSGYARLNLYAAADGYGAFNGNVNVTMNAALGGFNAQDSWNNDIGGAGGLTLNGTGRLILTGNDTYAGPTTVNGGTLEVDGAITSASTVNAGGTLAGAGTVGAVTVNRGGTLAPGASTALGTLTVNGNLTMAAGSTYAVRATPTGSDAARVNGSATLQGGTVAVNAGAGLYRASTRYGILTATGGVNGRFDGVTSNLAFLSPTLAYDTGTVTLTLNRNDLAFAAVAATGNQRAVASALDRVAPGINSVAGSGIVNGVSGLSAPQARTAFTGMAGDGLSGSRTAGLLAGELAMDAVSNHMIGQRAGAAAPGATRVGPWQVWTTIFGRSGTTSGDAALGSATLQAGVWGGLLGLDYRPNDRLTLGVVAGGSDGSFTAKSRATTGNLSGYHLGLHGEYRLGATYAFVGVQHSGFSNDTTRYAGGFGGLAVDRLTASYDAQELRGRLEIGHDFAAGAVRLTPYYAIDLAELRTDGFRERSGAGEGTLALRTRDASTHSAPQSLGLRVATALPVGPGWVLAPQAGVSWVHEYADRRNLSPALVALPGSDFVAAGTRPARDAARFTLGAGLTVRPGLTFFVDGIAQFSDVTRDWGGRGGLRYVF